MRVIFKKMTCKTDSVKWKLQLKDELYDFNVSGPKEACK